MNRRRVILVDGFQSQWVLTLLVWVAGLLVGFVALVLGPLAWQVSSGQASQADVESAAALLALHEHVWLPVVALFLGLALVVVQLTHRVAGPLYRFRVVFGELAKGNLSVSARIRKGDYLQLESQALQGAIDGLAERMKRAQEVVAVLDEDLAGLRACGEDDLARLRARAADARRTLSALRTERPAQRPPLEAPGALPVQPAPDAGFSLIELLLVSCITMTVTAIAVPAYTSALDRARVTRAMGDLNGVGKEITMFQISKGCYPASLADVNRGWMKDPWGRNYIYAVPQAPGGGGGGRGRGSCGACGGGCVTAGAARKDKNLVPINADFDLYSQGKDGATSGPLSAKQSQDDVIRGRSGAFVGLASEY